jgi:choice-of-anchor C domain-containing protein
MWIRRVVAATAAVVVGMTATAGTASATPLNGFTDGGFEDVAATVGSFDRYFAPATIGVWTVTQGSVDLSGAGFWQNADGNQSLDLDGAFDPGGVAQTFHTVPLLKYRVTYYLAGNPASGPAIKTGQVLANGNVIQNFAFDITGKTFTDMGYVKKHTHFLATSTSATLEFRSTTGSGFGPVIDAVHVESCLLVICVG